MINSPRSFGLDHDEWRQHQSETIEAITGSNKSFILEAPTGSGKTAIARAVSQAARTVALVRTKVLQKENYDAEYNFDALYGRSNYRCIHPRAKPNAMADECIFAEAGMAKCDKYEDCPYVNARETAKESRRSTLNYSYWLHVYEKWPPIDVLVCDEAHQLSEVVLEWAGCHVTSKERIDWKLPPFPMIRGEFQSRSVIAEGENHNVEVIALEWLMAARNILAREFIHLSFMAETDVEARKRLRKCELFGKKIRATIAAMEAVGDCWYIQSGPTSRGTGSISNWEFVAKPLTARYHFGRYFRTGNHRIILMSATIGDFDTFANELGIEQYDMMSVPSVWPAETRTVYQLDVPRLGQKASDADYNKQATEIARAINEADHSWCGLIHVNSKSEAYRLAERLRRQRWLDHRIFVQPELPTDKVVTAWDDRLAQVPNSIMICWALWEGYNGLREKINIVAKIPYPYLGDPYEQARMRFNGRFFQQRTAWKLEQGLGRTRRGRAEDYDIGGTNGLVAVADGGLNYIRSYLSTATKEAIVKR